MRFSRYSKVGSASLLAGGLFCGLAVGQEPAHEEPAPTAAAEAAEPPSQAPAPGPALPKANEPASPAPANTNDNLDLNSPSDRGNDQTPTTKRAEAGRANAAQDPANHRGDVDARPNNRRAAQGTRYNTANLGITFNSAAGGALTINEIGNQGYFRDAGLRRGDRIVSAGGRQFNDQNSFYVWLGTVRSGTRIPIVVLRGGQQTTVYWTPTAEFVQQYTQVGPSNAATFYGIHVDNQAQDAVIVAQVDPDSPADRAGVRMTDMIVAVNNQEVHNPREFAEATASMPQDQIANLAISRTFDMQIDPSMQRRAVEQRTSLPPAPAAAAVPATSPQPAVVVQPPVRQAPVPASRRGFFRRN